MTGNNVEKVSLEEVARYDIPMQLYMKKKEEDKTIKSVCNVFKIKLSKLVITRFNGTQIDWFRL